MRAWVLVLLLSLTIVPSTMELVEAVVHWVEHGDSAHGAGHETSALGGTDEHGCSGTFHLCPCHSANVLAPAVELQLDVYSLVAFEARLAPVSRIGVGATAPPIRPPIA